jgi:proteic killer suppression protein
MDVEFGDKDLSKLEADKDFAGGYSAEAIRGFRKVMQVIRAAKDERDFYAMKSLHFEKLKGNRSHERSMRLNKQWRLILSIAGEVSKAKVTVIGIEDYH